MAKFIKIQDVRYLKTTIKRYIPTGEKSINIHFNTSSSKIDFRNHNFKTKILRNEALDDLDCVFLDK